MTIEILFERTTAMTTNIQLVIVDDQYDFMDNPDSALPVPGGNADADRVAELVRVHGHRFSDIHVTLDSHHPVDVGHATMWLGANGTPPPPFTAIRAQDIRDRIWTPRNENAKPAALGGKTIREYMIDYAQQLEDQGSHLLMVWPQHCLIGTPGHAVQANLAAALKEWEEKQFANVDYVTKGTNPWTEHYGALQAEVPMATDPATGLNTGFLQTLAEADMIVFVGEALTHCVLETLRQVVNNLDPSLVRKIMLLTDCSSPIPAAPGGPDFPAIAAAAIKEMEAKGLQLGTSANLFD
jgi:nicotinamidase-related amidase